MSFNGLGGNVNVQSKKSYDLFKIKKYEQFEAIREQVAEDIEKFNYELAQTNPKEPEMDVTVTTTTTSEAVESDTLPYEKEISGNFKFSKNFNGKLTDIPAIMNLEFKGFVDETLDTMMDFGKVLQAFDEGNYTPKSKTNVWSSFYGGSAKHTKDHLNMAIFSKFSNPFNKNALNKNYFGSGRKEGSGWAKDFVDSGKKQYWKADNGNEYRVGQNLEYGSVTLASAKFAEAEFNAFQLKGQIGDENNYIGGEIDIAHFEASAGARIGPGYACVSAEAEASLIHIETNAKTQMVRETKYGDVNIVGASFNGSADVARVYANAKASCGVYTDEYGNTQFDAGVQAAIGADACRATGNANINIGGADIGVTGTVKIGIGAQVDVGFEDGKFNLHVGAALGIGVELGFSIDLSGAVENLQTAGKFVQDVGNYLYEETFVGDVVDWFCSW